MYSISSNSKILRPPCRSFTGRMVPRRVDRLKINHGHYFFISSFFVILLLMNATLGDNLYIITLHTYLNAGHKSQMCALITYFTTPMRVNNE